MRKASPKYELGITPLPLSLELSDSGNDLFLILRASAYFAREGGLIAKVMMMMIGYGRLRSYVRQN